MIDEQCACIHASKGPILAQADRAQVFVVTHAGKDNALSCRSFTRGRLCATFVIGGPALGLSGRAIIDGNGVPGGGEVAGHGETHDTKTEEGNVGHSNVP